jgi:aryl-alcohol dehydrogenase-like predicted oxidoreductase
MPTTMLGRTGLAVSKVGFGAMELRGPNGSWPRAIDDAIASRLLNLVIDSGVNLIDTAPDYGLSEGLIGKHVSHRRDEFYLATKCGCTISPNGAPLESDAHHFDRPNLRAAVEQSLRRMNTDYIDLIQFHHSPSREVLDANDSVAELGYDYTLLDLADDCDTTSFEEAFRERGAPLQIAKMDEPQLRGVYKGTLFLLRPDLHIAWRGDAPPVDTHSIVAIATGHGPPYRA